MAAVVFKKKKKKRKKPTLQGRAGAAPRYPGSCSCRDQLGSDKRPVTGRLLLLPHLH